MTTCSVHTITTHAKHHHHHPSLRFMGSGTGSHSGSGSGSNTPPPPPPPIKTEPQNEEDYSNKPPPSTQTKTPPTVHSPPVGLLNHRNLVQDEKLVVATLASFNSGDPSNIIKQDLRLIIQSRRKAEGKGELQVDFKTPPKDELTEEEWEKVRKRRDQNRLAAQRFRQKQRKISSTLSDQQLTSEELEKRARRRELNRLAAKRSREKGQRRKETLIQEIQGLQARNGALEGALGSLVEERDNLVRTLKGHLPHCQDSEAMTRSAQLLAFSHRLAQLLDWTIPGPGTLPSPSTDQPLVVDVQVSTPSQPPPRPHQMRDSSHHGPPSPSTPLPLGAAPPAFPSPAHHAASDLPSPSTHFPPTSRSHMHGVSQTEAAAGRDLEIDASAAAVLREEIERRHHRHPFRMTAPASPTLSSHSSSQLPTFSPRSSPPPSHPKSLPITPTHLLPSPSRSLPPPLPSPSHSLPPPLPSPSHSLPPFLPSPSHSLPAHLPSPSRSLPPFLHSPTHVHSPSHLPSPHSHLPSPHSHLPSPHSHLPSPHSHLPSPHSHLPSPHSHLPSPHSHLPSPLSHLPSPHSHLPSPLSHLPSPSPLSHLPSPHSHLPSPLAHLPSPHTHLPSPHSHLPSPHSHLPSPSHPLPPPLPSPSHPFPSHASSPSLPRPTHLALDTGGGLRDTGSHLVSFTGTPQEERVRSPMSNPALLRSPKESPTVVKRPSSLDLRGVGIIPKKDPALRSPVHPKKDPALRSPVIPKKDPALRSPVVPMKDGTLRSPTIPKKDPALRSPIIETSPSPLITSTASPVAALRTSGLFKRGPVQRVASFHGVLAQSPGEQVTPLNLSKRRKSEDFGSFVAGEQDPATSQPTGFSGLPPPGAASWVKQEEVVERPLNLVCREQPSATITSDQSGSAQDTPTQPKRPFAFKREGQASRDDEDVLTSVPRRLMRFNSYDGSS